jgi:hypothetical protein
VKKITKIVNILLCTGMAGLPLSALSTDSTVLTPPPTTTAALTTFTALDPVAAACFNTSQAGAINVSSTSTAPLGTYTSPYYLQLGSAATNTVLAIPSPSAATITTTVPTTGYYYVTLNLQIEQKTADPVYYWVDNWASTVDVGGKTTQVRLFYSGDVPYTLNTGGDNVVTVIFTGGAYLQKGATILSPRIWSQPDPSDGSAPQLCIEGTGYLNGTTGSTFSASLLKFP